MMWTVISDRTVWNFGDRLDDDALSGCNIDALVQGGHIEPVQDEPKTKRMPVTPATDTANEPEEQ